LRAGISIFEPTKTLLKTTKQKSLLRRITKTNKQIYTNQGDIRIIMKSIRSIAAVLFFAVLFAVPAFAQTATPAGANTSKIALINSAFFDDEKTGITKYIQAFKTLDTEFQPVRTELQGMQTKLQGIAKEIETLQKSTGTPVSQQTILAKQEEGENLQRQLKFKQEDANAKFEKRYGALIGPLQADIGKAIQEYAKQKGFLIVFDASKDEKGMLLWADMGSVDATTDFIKFYNARPAGTAAATAAPK
jgi:Skp family chaperone for outer membrane proteins